MKLWYSTTSAYVRKVRAVAAYHGLALEEMKISQASFSEQAEHNQDNPLGRIPVLQTDEGEWLYSSNVIAEYLDALGQQPKLYPQDETRWAALNLHALAEGILDNTVIVLADKMLRPEQEWWTVRHEQIKQRNARTFPVLLERIKPFGMQLNIGTLNAVCAIDFLDFRDALTEVSQSGHFAELKNWAAAMNQQYPWLAALKPFIS